MRKTKKRWIVFQQEVSDYGIVIKEECVLMTEVPEAKLRKILTSENKRRRFDRKPRLAYLEMDKTPRDILNQFYNGQCIGRREEFKDFVNTLLQEPERTDAGEPKKQEIYARISPVVENSDAGEPVIRISCITETPSVETPPDETSSVENLAIEDRDKYFLSISDDDIRRATMRIKGKMKPKAIKEWEKIHNFPFCSIHGIYESINRGKNKLHIPKKPRKQNNSKPKK